MTKCYIDSCRFEAQMICPNCGKPVCLSHAEVRGGDPRTGRPLGFGRVDTINVCYKCWYDIYGDGYVP